MRLRHDASHVALSSEYRLPAGRGNGIGYQKLVSHRRAVIDHTFDVQNQLRFEPTFPDGVICVS